MHVNNATFLVEVLPSKKNLDLELDKYNRVTKCKSFNHQNENMVLTPVDEQTWVSELKLPQTNLCKTLWTKI